ncbi:hypothetical protein SAMN05444167_2600 [Terriglobus roseus]|uniref:Uncharacterized protein n=1 Tax=Terriglobus roseus TaxID=392734 RepID=A0A1G7LRN3_9BACT|nr:hypothetical protein SAMN05444167_2600 [Terriglobus roseus]
MHTVTTTHDWTYRIAACGCGLLFLWVLFF